MIIIYLMIAGISFVITLFEEGASVAAGFIWMIVLFLILVLLQNINYKNGQVDALTGNIKYELVVNPDSSKTWQEIK